MSRWPSFASIATGLTLFVVVAYISWQIIFQPYQAKSSEKPPAPAKVDKVLKEDQLNTIVLSPAAATRLQIQTTPLRAHAVQRTRVYGGEIVVPFGNSVIVSAPVSGVLKEPPAGVPQLGTLISKAQPIFSLVPILSPEGRTTIASALVDAEGQVKNATAQRDATQIALERAQRLFKEQAGSQRNVDETQAAFELASKTLDAAVARQRVLAQLVGDQAADNANAIAVDAPLTGILRNIWARPGQAVASGAALFELADLSHLWVRIPLSGGDLGDVEREISIEVHPLAAHSTTLATQARPVTAPPSANAITSTVDLFYEFDNRSNLYAPGERVSTKLPLRDSAQSLVIPRSAIVIDLYGGGWVYEETAERTYVRRRVDVKFVHEGNAVLSSGPSVGTKIVTSGAIELFGTETGFSK